MKTGHLVLSESQAQSTAQESTGAAFTPESPGSHKPSSEKPISAEAEQEKPHMAQKERDSGTELKLPVLTESTKATMTDLLDTTAQSVLVCLHFKNLSETDAPQSSSLISAQAQVSNLPR